MEIKSRRFFLKAVLAAVASFFVFIWNRITLDSLKFSVQSENSLPLIKNKTVSFSDNYIIVNLNETTKVFSSHCTHLGCKIGKAEEGKLVCPCHGSEYDFQGRVLKGPSYKNLESVPFRISGDGNKILIGN